jgi:hypothetical protein
MNFTFNPWVWASAGGQYVHEGLYSPIANYFSTCMYLLENMDMNSTVKKKINFTLNSFQNKGFNISLMHSSLTFSRFGSISWHSVGLLGFVGSLQL